MNITTNDLSWLTLIARHPNRPDRKSFDESLSEDGRTVSEILALMHQVKPVTGFDGNLVEVATSLRNWSADNPDPEPPPASRISEETIDRVRKIAETEAWEA